MDSRVPPPPLTVRVHFSYWPHLMAGLVAFLVTGLVVHFFTQRGRRQEAEAKPSPVCVRIELPQAILAGAAVGDSHVFAAQKRGESPGLPPDAAKGLESYFRRPEPLRQAWQEFVNRRKFIPPGEPADPLGSFERFASSLRVLAKKSESGCRLEFQLDSSFPNEAVSCLKILAEQFVRRCQAHLAESAQRQALLSQEEFRRAKVEYREAQERLHRFEEEFLRQQAGGQDLVQKMQETQQHRQLRQEIAAAAAEYDRIKEAIQTPEVSLPELPRDAIQVFIPTASAFRPAGDFFLFGWSIGSGLAMALGVCLISFGTALEPLVARLGDLEKIVGVPVLGTVPLRSSGVSPASRGRWRGLCRFTLILSGLLLVLAATAAILIVVSRFV
jgi:hypothetical protein